MALRRWRGLGMWGLALGYFAWYVPYSALAKGLSSGILPGFRGAVSGFELLPAVALGSLAGMPVFVALSGWFGYARRRRVWGLEVPVPGREVLWAAFWTALLIGATTLNYTFSGVSILFMLLVMRGGVLVVSPLVDRLRRRSVHPSAWVALALSLIAVVVALSDVQSYALTWAAGLSLAIYLAGYVGRFLVMSRHAKVGDEEVNRRYFIEEHMASTPMLVLLLAIPAVIGSGEIALDLRHGFTTFLGTGAALPAFAIGLLYEALFVFGSLIYVSRREYTYCVPLNRCSSLLAGVVASWAVTVLWGAKPPSPAQYVAAGWVLLALLALSWPVLAAAARRRVAPSVPTAPTPGERLFLFVCSGNTCRSPMAAAIARAEIAARGISGWSVLSGGLTPRLGAPMTPEAVVALRELGVPSGGHQARAVTFEEIARAERVFCMTSALRQAVCALAPDAAARIVCLDPDGDLPDPIGQAMPVYTRCAGRILELVRRRLSALDGAAYSGSADA